MGLDIKEYHKAYYLANIDKYKEYSHQYYLDHKEEDKERNKEYTKQWRLDNPEKVKLQGQRSVQRLKVHVLFHYSKNDPSCVRCGNADVDVLCIDHIHGDGNQQRKRDKTGLGNAFYGWLKRNNFPEGFQVLCWNCNIKKRIREHC